MSYDISSQVQNARSRAELRAQTETEDKARDVFMATMAQHGKTLTDFEERFVENWAASLRSKPWWTPKRRDVADELKRKYL